MKLQLVFATFFLLAGCTEPERTGPPVGYVDQNVHRDLQARYSEALNAQHQTEEDNASMQVEIDRLQGNLEAAKSEARPITATSLSNARSNAMGVERNFIIFDEWKQGAPTPGQRSFDHASGTSVAFTERDGVPIMSIVYDDTDQQQRDAAYGAIRSLVWMGGVERDNVDYNTQAISQWKNTDPKVLSLKGGTVERSQFEDTVRYTARFE
jgi:hypothetical protein